MYPLSAFAVLTLASSASISIVAVSQPVKYFHHRHSHLVQVLPEFEMDALDLAPPLMIGDHGVKLAPAAFSVWSQG